MIKDHGYFFVLFTPLLISTDCLCSDAKKFASLMSTRTRTQREQLPSSINPRALYDNIFPEIVTQYRQLYIPKKVSKKTVPSELHKLWSLIKNGSLNLISFHALRKEKNGNNTEENQTRCGSIVLPLVRQKKLAVQTGALLSIIIMILTCRNVKKEYGESILLNPAALRLFIVFIIHEIRKYYCRTNVIGPLLFKPIAENDEQGRLQLIGYTDVELRELERILMLFDKHNAVICGALNHHITYDEIRPVFKETHRFICYGTMLDALFFRAALGFDERALQLFFKYNVHNKIDTMRLRRMGTFYCGSSLLGCMACVYLDSEKVIDSMQRMLDVIPFKNNDQVECFINDIVENAMDWDVFNAAKKAEKMIKYDKISKMETAPRSRLDPFSDFLTQDKILFLSSSTYFIKLALQYMTDIKTINPYYHGIDINYFIRSKHIKGRSFLEVIKPLFLRSREWYGYANKNLDLLGAIESFLIKGSTQRQNSLDYYEAFFHCIQLFLSYGIKIPDFNKIKNKIDYTQIEESVREKLYQDLVGMLQQELDFRKQFLRFDDQENRSELFRHILERTSQPAVWMIRVARSAREESQIHTLFSYCIKQFYELLKKSMWDKQYIQYVDSWKSLLIFLPQHNPNILPRNNLNILCKHKNIIGKCMVKILEYAYFFPQHDISKIEDCLIYFLAKDDPEVPFPNLCKQGKLGNIFHIAARSGRYNDTLKEIMEIAKAKNQELSVLRGLTQTFNRRDFNDNGHTPIELAEEEIYFAHKERDDSRIEETLTVMNNFLDICFVKLSEYKKSPHTAHSSWEDGVNESMTKSRKALRRQMDLL